MPDGTTPGTALTNRTRCAALPANPPVGSRQLSLLDVQQGLHRFPADRALVCLIAQRVSTRLADAHVPAWQHCRVPRRTHADDTLAPLDVVCRRAQGCGACACRIHAVDFLQLVAHAIHPDLLLEDLQRPLVVVVFLELCIRALRLHPLRQGCTDRQLQRHNDKDRNHSKAQDVSGQALQKTLAQVAGTRSALDKHTSSCTAPDACRQSNPSRN